MVITTSAACTLSVVSGLGNSREMSRPISAMAWTTAGLSWPAGWDPAEETRTRPAAWWSSRAAAIWERPALCVQTNSTSGMSVTGGCLPRSAGLLGWILMVGDDDVGRVGRGRPRIQRADHEHGQGAADDLGGDERRGRGGGDAGEGVGEHPAYGDRRVGEAGGGGEEV